MGIRQASKQKTNWTESWDLGDQLALFLMLVVEGLLVLAPAMGPSSEGCPHGGFIAEPRSTGF